MGDEDMIERHARPTESGEAGPQQAFPEPIEYPDSDGHFLPPHPLQSNAIVELRGNLKQHFQDMPNVVMEGGMFMYYAEGEADERRVLGRRVGKYVSPDVFVVLDHDLGRRPTYKLWVEGKPPDFALDVISPSSDLRNQQDKLELYGRIGVRECFLFQPDVQCPSPRVVGYTLRGGEYRELGPDPALPGAGAVLSEVLGLSFRPKGAFLRVREQYSGEDYPWIDEWATAVKVLDGYRLRAATRADRVAAARRAVESRPAASEERLGRNVPQPLDDD